jgi:hypothetical protein
MLLNSRSVEAELPRAGTHFAGKRVKYVTSKR